jgi:membrane associated rhomboid family serine protease
MIGPSSEMLINLGARFTACMRSIPEISSTPFLCLNDTGNTANAAATQTCTLEDICGFGGFGNDGIPNQTFRFFTPLWLHVGVVHLLLNGLVLLTSSALVEKQIGTLK